MSTLCDCGASDCRCRAYRGRGQPVWWVECEDCGGTGVDGHECGEDVCCCAEPEDNIPCDSCHGKGGWWVDKDDAPEPDEPTAAESDQAAAEYENAREDARECHNGREGRTQQ